MCGPNRWRLASPQTTEKAEERTVWETGTHNPVPAAALGKICHNSLVYCASSIVSHTQIY
jgi:hypothetical protein